MAGDTDLSDDSLENELVCSACKRKVNRSSAVRCVLCDGFSHNSCITRLKGTKSITADKVLCCSSKVSLDTLAMFIVSLVKASVASETEMNLMRDLLTEMKGKNQLLEEKIANMGKLPNPTFAEATKMNTYKDKTDSPDVKLNIPAIIIEPKVKQDSEVTKRELQSRINPVQLGVSIKSVRKMNDGRLIINCPTLDDANKLLDETQASLHETCNIKLSKLTNPRIKIVGYSSDVVSNEDIESKIISQNKFITPEDYLKVTYVRKGLGNKPSTIYAEVSPILYHKFLHYNKIYIDWERFPVYEDLWITKCTNCQSYSHKTRNCTVSSVCGYCAGNHGLADCNSQVTKCKPCMEANLKYKNLNINPDHDSNSKDCPTYLFHLNRIKSKINYGT